MHKLIFLAQTATCGFELFVCGIISYVTMAAIHPIRTVIIFPENYKMSTIVSYQHDILVMIIKSEHDTSSKNLQSFL
jgi:hypothetical protein